jgi:tyrosinase
MRNLPQCPDISTLANYDDRSTLTAAERIAYTNAVLCFQNKSAQTPTSLIPGARSRFDDFVGTHINQTLNIHYTVSHPSILPQSCASL